MEALARELFEETGLVLTDPAAPDAADHPYEDGVLDMRWWSLDEVEAAHRQSVLFGPRAFPRLMGDLLDEHKYEAMKRVPLLLGL